MEDKFYTPELANMVANAKASFDFGGAPPPPAVSEQERLFRGPLAVDYVLPLTPSNVAAVATLRAQAAAAWLAWQQDPAHLHRPGTGLPYISGCCYSLHFNISVVLLHLSARSQFYCALFPYTTMRAFTRHLIFF